MCNIYTLSRKYCVTDGSFIRPTSRDRCPSKNPAFELIVAKIRLKKNGFQPLYGFAEVTKNLTRYRSKNNFVGPSK